jgi:hypothetical protein
MWARWGTALIVLGVPPTLAQFALDLLGAHRATTQADMDAFFGKLLATPMIAIPLYQIGPSVVYVGWLLHAIGLLRTRVVPSWVSVLLIVALLCIASGQVRRQFGLVLAGHIVFGCGSVPLVWYVLTWKEHS